MVSQKLSVMILYMTCSTGEENIFEKAQTLKEFQKLTKILSEPGIQYAAGGRDNIMERTDQQKY